MEFKRVPGIYKITNLVNGKCYIGSTNSLKTRKNAHFSQLNENKHVNGHLQAAWNKYGKDNFSFETVEECEIENLSTLEQKWINFHKSYNDESGYNIVKYTNGRTFHSEETKRKISDAHKGKILSEETKQRMSGERNHNFGKLLSKETRQRMSDSRKGEKNHFYGKNHSEETRKEMSKSHKGIQAGENHPMFGKNHSEETILKLSGENGSNVKLTEKQVIEIKNKYIPKIYSQSMLAKEYNVSRSMIEHILNGKSWKMTERLKNEK